MTQVVINDIYPYTQTISMANQTIYSTNWTANYSTDVKVYYTPDGATPDDATQLLNSSQYTVDFIGDSLTVQVTLVTPASANDIVTIIRDTPADRQNLYSNTNFTPSMLNNDFGILTLVDQQAQLVNQQVAPRYNYSATTNTGVDNILPVLPASSVWMKNSGNTAIVSTVLGSVVSKNATDPNQPNVASVSGAFVPGHLVVAADSLGTIEDFGAPPSLGTVTSILTGTGLTGGPITTTGTLAFEPIPAHTFWANTSDVMATPTATSLITNPLTLLFDADSGSTGLTNNTITISGGTTGLTTSAAASTINLEGTLGLAHGGTNADLSTTGGTSKVLKQTTMGGAVTVAQLAASDLSNGTTGSGAAVLATSPTLTTPSLGVASATSLSFGGSALARYEVGTWTPTDASGASLTFTGVSAGYTVIGNMAFVYVELTYPSTADGSQAIITGLPVAVPNAGYAVQGLLSLNTTTIAVKIVTIKNSTSCSFYTSTDVPVTNAELSTATINGILTYPIS